MMITMKGYPKHIATKQDFINLLQMPEYRQQALEDLLIIAYYADEQNPNPLYKQKGFKTRQEAMDLIRQYLTKEEVKTLIDVQRDKLRRDLLARRLSDDIELYPKAKSQGLKLPTIGEYAHSLQSSEDDNLFINNYGAVNFDPDCFVAVQTDENHFRFVPGHEFSSRLYRGQSKFYEHCCASMFRESKDEIKLIVDAIRKEEFILLIKTHPILILTQKIKIIDLYFQVDFEGLAQHYRFNTRYLDLTRSKDIAMFFATCDYDENKDVYEPTNSKEGVLYTVDLFQGLTNKNKKIGIVGLQALPRPGIQKAFSVALGDKENFNRLLYVSYETFKITRELSEKYFNKFNGGKDLFIKDTIWDKAKQIRSYDSLSKDAFIIYCQKQGIDQRIEEKKLLKCGIIFRDYNIKFTKQELLSIKEESKLVKFRTGARFVADPLVINEWPDSQQCMGCIHVIFVLEESLTCSCDRNCVASSQECKENRKEANKEN